jgi:CBS domain-containing protein
MKAVRDVMTSSILSVAPTASVREASTAMFRSHAGSVLVMEGGTLLGIFTERDVMRALATHDADTGRMARVHAWMSRDPVTVSPDATVGAALDRMLEGGFRHLVVVEGEAVVGVVSMRDLTQAISRTRPPA